MTNLLRQVQAQLGVLGMAVVFLAAIVVLFLAVKLTKFLLKYVLLVLLLAVLGGAAWWVYIACSK